MLPRMCTSGSERPSACGPSGLLCRVHPAGPVLFREVVAQGVAWRAGRCRRLRSLSHERVSVCREGLGGPGSRLRVPPCEMRNPLDWPMGGSGTKQGRKDWRGVTPRMVEITWGLRSRGWTPGVGRCVCLMSSRVVKPHGRAVESVVPFACEHRGSVFGRLFGRTL